MQSATATHRPTMLVLCTCLPDPDGDAAQQHAWSLLRLVHRTHRVTLAVANARPVHLTQWRLWSTVADRIELHATAFRRKNAAKHIMEWLGLLGRGSSDAPNCFECMARRYDAALCGDPQCWSLFGNVLAAARLCDVHGADPATSVAIAQTADVVLVSPAQAATLTGLPARIVTLLPVRDDLAQHVQSHRLALSMTPAAGDLRPATAPYNVTWRSQTASPARLAA